MYISALVLLSQKYLANGRMKSRIPCQEKIEAISGHMAQMQNCDCTTKIVEKVVGMCPVGYHIVRPTLSYMKTTCNARSRLDLQPLPMFTFFTYDCE